MANFLPVFRNKTIFHQPLSITNKFLLDWSFYFVLLKVGITSEFWFTEDLTKNKLCNLLLFYICLCHLCVIKFIVYLSIEFLIQSNFNKNTFVFYLFLCCPKNIFDVIYWLLEWLFLKYIFIPSVARTEWHLPLLRGQLTAPGSS